LFERFNANFSEGHLTPTGRFLSIALAAGRLFMGGLAGCARRPAPAQKTEPGQQEAGRQKVEICVENAVAAEGPQNNTLTFATNPSKGDGWKNQQFNSGGDHATNRLDVMGVVSTPPDGGPQQVTMYAFVDDSPHDHAAYARAHMADVSRQNQITGDGGVANNNPRRQEDRARAQANQTLSRTTVDNAMHDVQKCLQSSGTPPLTKPFKPFAP
jgi:hypothetical protein